MLPVWQVEKLFRVLNQTQLIIILIKQYCHFLTQTVESIILPPYIRHKCFGFKTKVWKSLFKRLGAQNIVCGHPVVVSNILVTENIFQTTINDVQVDVYDARRQQNCEIVKFCIHKKRVKELNPRINNIEIMLR